MEFDKAAMGIAAETLRMMRNNDTQVRKRRGYIVSENGYNTT